MEMKLLRSINIPRSRCQIALAAEANMIAVNCQREIFVFEESGKEISRWSIPGKQRLGGIAVNKTGTHCVLQAENEIQLYRTSGKLQATRKHSRWGQDSFGNSEFSPCGDYLWAVSPGENPRTPITQILDIKDLNVISEQSLEIDEECYFSFYFHPDNKTVFLNAGAGQDGIWTFKCSFSKGNLSVKHLADLDWRPVYAIHPTRKEILTGSYMDGCIQRRSWPSRKVLVEVEEEYCHPSGDPIYIDSDRILLLTDDVEIFLLDSMSLQMVDRVKVKKYNDFQSIHRMGDMLITSHRKNKKIHLWACPP